MKETASSEKPSVLLLHGLTGSVTEMKHLERKLRRAGYTVGVPMLPGHGAGIPELLATDRHDWLRGATEAMKELSRANPRGVVVVGLCASSLLAAFIAAQNKEVSGLVLLSTHYGRYSRGSTKRRWLLPFVYLWPWLRRHSWWTEEAPYGLKDTKLIAAITAALNASKNNETDSHGTFRTYVETFYQCELLAKEARRHVGEITCPTLLVHSFEDTWFGLENSAMIANDLVNCKKTITYLTNCNHVLSVDLSKDDVAGLLIDFLENEFQTPGEAIAA